MKIVIKKDDWLKINAVLIYIKENMFDFVDEVKTLKDDRVLLTLKNKAFITILKINDIRYIIKSDK